MSSSSSPSGSGIPTLIRTPLTALLGIQHPILLAGMARTSGGLLAAAVSNAGGLGVVGGFMYTPEQLRDIVAELKAHLRDPALPWGLDLAIPQVGGGARRTNHDYTRGRLDELVDIAVAEGARLFVSAVGVPPRDVIERLHAHDILVMNMVGHPRHAEKALDLGVDMVCAQGGEGGGHTGDLGTTVLVPAVADVARRYNPPLLAKLLRGKGAYGDIGGGGGGPPTALVVAAGGIADGRGLAAALMSGASGAWVGTRFVAATEAACSAEHKAAVVSAPWGDTERTLVVSGRPLRVRPNAYIRAWHARPAEVQALCDTGVVPLEHDLERGREVDLPHLMGQVAGGIQEVKPAAEIVRDMVTQAAEMLRMGGTFLVEGGGTGGGAAKL